MDGQVERGLNGTLVKRGGIWKYSVLVWDGSDRQLYELGRYETWMKANLVSDQCYRLLLKQQAQGRKLASDDVLGAHRTADYQVQEAYELSDAFDTMLVLKAHGLIIVDADEAIVMDEDGDLYFLDDDGALIAIDD